MPVHSKLSELVSRVSLTNRIPEWRDALLNGSEGFYIRGSIIVMVLTATAGVLQKGIHALWLKASSFFMLSITIDSKDESYNWIIEWLSEHPYAKRASRLSLQTVYDSEHGNSSSANPRPKLVLFPSLGSHFLTYKGNMFWLSRVRDTNANDLTNGGFYESITITLLGRNRNAVKELITDAMDLTFEKDEGKLVIYTNSGGSWSRFGSPRIPRPLSTVILDEEIKSKILNDIKEFLDSGKWYREMGIPYRRGYLLHGYPGTGKSSFIKAIAGELKMSLCLVSLSDKDMNDEQINSLLNNAPPRSILLLEDIDAAFIDRDSSETQQFVNHVTFSGLLNALDGVGAQEGRIVFMTTNKVDVLDPALIRPGRVDSITFFGLANKFQIGKLFERFYPSVDRELVKHFESLIPEQTVTMADLQGFLLEHKSNPRQAITSVDSFLKNVKPYGPTKFMN